MAASRWISSARNKTWLVGFLSGLVGLLIGLYVSFVATGQDYELLPLFAFLAAFVTSSTLWWWIAARSETRRLARGAIAGALSGIIAHYVCWYLLILANNWCYWLTGGCLDSLGQPPIDLLNAIWGAAVLSLPSLFFFGWLTVSLGALIGGTVAANFLGPLCKRLSVSLTKVRSSISSR
jgi:hypothetical protein